MCYEYKAQKANESRSGDFWLQVSQLEANNKLYYIFKRGNQLSYFSATEWFENKTFGKYLTCFRNGSDFEKYSMNVTDCKTVS